MKLWILLASFICYIFLSERWLKKKFSIQRSKGWITKYVNKAHKIMELTLFTTVIIGLLFISKGINVHYWLFPYLILLFLVRSFMKWKYERERKEYILELNGVFTLLIFITILYTDWV